MTQRPWGSLAIVTRLFDGADPLFFNSWSALIADGIRSGDVVMSATVRMAAHHASNPHDRLDAALRELRPREPTDGRRLHDLLQRARLLRRGPGLDGRREARDGLLQRRARLQAPRSGGGLLAGEVNMRTG